ncbi:MAG TPA: DUF883 C-terminal domain-containing protein [Verrucomicrobiae bacterium]|nr:DUF883 C-terminal domain-containing protein [Verrucomicrobiae bacterium]
MNNAEFPLPEAEVHKLDDVEEKLAQQPAIEKFKDAVRARPWAFVGAAAFLGFLCGSALTKR